jgi:hypothetical protein
MDRIPDAHSGTELMAELRQVEVSMDAAPTADLVMAQPQFLLGLAETTFNRPAVEGDSQWWTRPTTVRAGRYFGPIDGAGAGLGGLRRAVFVTNDETTLRPTVFPRPLLLRPEPDEAVNPNTPVQPRALEF